MPETVDVEARASPAEAGQTEAALAFHRRGQLPQAAQIYERILHADAGNFDALHGLGLIRLQQGRSAEAIELLGRAVRRRPASLEAQGNLGNALVSVGRLEEALLHYREALSIAPNSAPTHYNAGWVVRQLGRPGEAIGHYRIALALEPEFAEAHCEWGTALALMGQNDAAVSHYRTAIALKPTFAEAHCDLGIALAALGQHDSALAHYQKALQLKALPDARFNRALLLLLRGEYAEGWKEFEWRWRARDGLRPRGFAQPNWLGVPDVAGKTILLHAEQGLGDTLQFARYAPLLADRGARVVLEVQTPLVRLLSRLSGVADVRAAGDPLPPFDLHCALMSLPLAFGTRLETIPGSAPYLAAEPTLIEAWRPRVAALPGLRVGLVWAGAPRPFQLTAHVVDRRRSIALSQLAPLAAVPGVSFVSLQKGEPAAQARTPPAGMTLHDWTAELDDFADTAALVSLLDLVISVDTSVAHLVGGLAKPVWMLNRFDSCWRWLEHRLDSPWYPTLRQFRQAKPGDWTPVIAAIANALAAAARDRDGGSAVR